MDRLRIVLLLAFFLQACSLNDLFPAPATNTPPPTKTSLITFTPADTATSANTPIPTASATIVRFPTQDPSLPTATFEPVPIFIGMDTATPFTSLLTPPRAGPGFTSMYISDGKIYWGSCTPNRTRIVTEVEDPQDVISVVIFVRVRSAKKDDFTPWTTGNVMFNNGGGKFSYTLRANETEGHNHYKDSWIQFQLVATGKNGQEVGRTHIFEQSIALAPCPCLTPLTGCPFSTPKP